MPDRLLDICDLSLAIGGVPILDRVSLSIAPGEAHGLVGESGSGKSLTALTIAGLLPRGSRASGRVEFASTDVLTAGEPALRRLRGDRIGMVFQEPMTALNPMQRADAQVAETVLLHRSVSREEATERARAQLARVGIDAALAERYPHQLSGGQRQRVVIAIATILAPDLVVADEPTTALDVVRQREVLDLLRELEAEHRSALLLISHDLAVVAEMADRITVMRDGRVVERTEPAELKAPERDPYTRTLVAGTSLQRLAPPPPADAAPVLSLRAVSRVYGGGWGRAPTVALDGVSLDVPRGGAVGLVGGSGSGKSTLARIALMLDRPTTGTVTLDGTELTQLSAKRLLQHRREMQIVFQDPNGSFDPRRRVGWSVAEGLHPLGPLARSEREDRVRDALERVGLDVDVAHRYPHEFSGGQRQRLAIARAVVSRPKLIVADEPVSALDVSVRGMVLDLFARLREELGVAILFIGHDLGVLRVVAHSVAVMHEGRIVERGATIDVLENPTHPATRALVQAAPDLDAAIAQAKARKAMQELKMSSASR